MNDLVSIITPCYNSSKYIAQMMDSVLAQTYPNWELLITDDCSTDNSREIVQSYCEKDPRIKLFILENNSGAGVARNKSIEEAKGRYIAFLDSDDLWRPEKLEKQLEFMQKNNYKFVTCQTLVIEEDGSLSGFSRRLPKVSSWLEKYINFIGTSAVVYDTKEIGKFHMKPIRRRQDWILWQDILKVTKHAYCLMEPLSIYRNAAGSLSSNKFKLFNYHVTLYKEYWGHSTLYSYFLCYCVSMPLFALKKIYNRYHSNKYVKKHQGEKYV